MQGEEKLGRENGENQIPHGEEAHSEAVEQVDQSGESQSPDSETLTSGGSEERQPIRGGHALMEQWLEQIEGDPGQLMQQQFRLEEYKYLRSQGGRDRETRPW